jgi:hypothetical protein
MEIISGQEINEISGGSMPLTAPGYALVGWWVLRRIPLPQPMPYPLPLIM